MRLELLERDRLLHATAHHGRHDHHRNRHQKRDTPAPRLHLLGTEDEAGQPAHRGCQRTANRYPHRRERTVKATLATRCGFRHVRGRARHLATGKEALRQPDQQQQHRRDQPCAGRRGQQPHQPRRHAHADHGHQQDRAAAEPVPQSPEHDAAHRPHQECAAEHSQDGEQRCGGVVARKEHRADGAGKVTVDAELVVLDGGAGGGGKCSLAGSDLGVGYRWCGGQRQSRSGGAGHGVALPLV